MDRAEPIRTDEAVCPNCPPGHDCASGNYFTVPCAPTNAAELPDGTQVSYQGMTFTAYPAYCSAFRWHAGPMMLTDEAMTEALDWEHAQVTGHDARAIGLYEQILNDCRDS